MKLVRKFFGAAMAANLACIAASATQAQLPLPHLEPPRNPFQDIKPPPNPLPSVDDLKRGAEGTVKGTQDQLQQTKNDAQKAIDAVKDQFDPQRQLDNAMSVAKALASGDMTEIRRSIGRAALESTSCPLCGYLTQQVFPKFSRDQIDQIAGEGFITAVGTQDPVLVVLDVATNVITQYPFNEEDPTSDDASSAAAPAQATAPAPKPVRRFTAVADCVSVRGNTNEVYASFKDEPKVTNEKGDKVGHYSLAKGARIDVTTAPGAKCDMDQPNIEQKTVATQSMTYDHFKYVADDPDQNKPDILKFALVGKPINN